MIKNNKKILIGLSGGVDSAIAAYLLVQQGFDVTAVYMQNWDDQLNLATDLSHEKNHVCSQAVDYEDAQFVATKLNIRLVKLNYICEYWDQVFLPFLADLRIGLTPNPDVLCNRFIKFGCLCDFAFKKNQFDFLATGHYASICKKNNQHCLSFSADTNKDQTYFLNQINQKYLTRIIFPLANLKKPQVREMAASQKYNSVSNKNDSTGICFIGERNYIKFLKNYLPIKVGKIKNFFTNDFIGDHIGHYFYTIGQNKGFNLKKSHQKMILVKKDYQKNILYICPVEQAKLLYITQVKLKNFNLLVSELTFPFQCKARLRHRAPLISITLHYNNVNNNFFVTGNFLKTNVVFGQYLVCYQDDICIGGGIIYEG